ncbi:MAG: hypothetical protein JXA33_28335 [Anaerolineae bacterium]|nr:hypothetical protein [Anaerolineae bacterium]
MVMREVKVDKTQAQQFRNRWQAAEEIQQQEARTATIEWRWRQLNALYCLSKELGLSPDQSDEAQGYAQWAQLKEKAGRPNKI